MGSGASGEERKGDSSRAVAQSRKEKENERNLLEAVTSRNVQDTHHYIKRHRNVNFCDAAGKTPLHRAASNGDVDIVRLLIQAGADVNMLPNSKEPAVRFRSALHEASERGHRRIIELLVRAGANIGQKDIRQRNAVDIACERGHRAAVHCLLNEGAAMQRNLEHDLLQLNANIRLYQPEARQWLLVPPKTDVNTNNFPLKLQDEELLISDIFDFRDTGVEVSPDQVCVLKLPHHQDVPDETRKIVAVLGRQDGLLMGLPTWEFSFKSLELQPYVVAEIVQLSWFAVVSRPLSDSFTVGSSGGKFTSTADPRASINIPPSESTSDEMRVDLELLPVDESTTKRAQKHDDGCKLVQSAGTVLRVTVTRPDGTDERLQTTNPITLQLPAPRLLKEQSEVDESELRILQDRQDNQWWDVTGEMDHSVVKDRIKCQLQKLETAGYITTYAKDIEGLAEAFGTVFMYRHKFDVNMLLYYDDSNTDDVQLYVGCCLSKDTDEQTNYLKENGFKRCKLPSKDVSLREGEMFYIEFSGNVQPRDEKQTEDSLWFTFHSRRRRNHTEISVKVVDDSQEPSSEVYFKRPSQRRPSHAASGSRESIRQKSDTDERFLSMRVRLPQMPGVGVAASHFIRTPKMCPEYQELLKKNRVVIVDNIDRTSLPELMNHLIQDDVIDPEDAEELREEHKTKRKMVAALLDLLPYKEDFVFVKLVEALQKTKHPFLAALLLGKVKPEPPTNVSVTPDSSGSLTVSWTPGFDGGCEQQFEISYCQKGHSNVISPPLEVKDPGATSYQISGLQAGTTYVVKVRGVNDLGPGEYQAQDTEGTTKAEPTMSQRNQEILKKTRYEVMEKMQPEEVFEHLVENQVIDAKEAADLRQNHAAREMVVCALLDLLPFRGDRAFEMLLMALDMTGQSYLVALLRQAEKPALPTKVAVTFSRHDSLEVSWTPGYDGGSMQHFEITCHKKDQHSNISTPIEVTTPGVTTLRISGLEPRTTYTVKVRGVNVMGEGEYQDTDGTTRAEPTMSEQYQKILEKHRAALVDRMKPQNVVDYLIQTKDIEAVEAENMVHISQSRKPIVRRLLEFLPYNGDKAFNGLLTYLEETSQDYCNALLHGVVKPDPPTDVTVTCVSHESLHVTWTPGRDGGSPQHFDVIYQKREKGTVFTTASSHTIEVKGEGISNCLIEGLQESTVYVVKVRGVNVLGPGEFQSKDVEGATSAGPSMSRQYQDLLLKARAEAAEIMSPEGVISYLVNEKVLEAEEASIIRTSHTSSSERVCALLDLLPYKGDEGYTALLVALEATDQKYLADVFSGKEKPSPPTDVTLTSTCYDSMNVSWTPGSDGGSEQYFQITYRNKDENGAFIEPPIEVRTPHVQNYQIQDLQESTTYVVKVRGVNELGPGEYQALDTEGTTRGAPPYPSFLSVKKKTTSSITLSWKPARSEEDPWEDYYLQYKTSTQGATFPFSAPIRVAPQLATQYEVRGLEPDTAYSIKLYAKNASKTSKTSVITGVTEPLS